MKIDNAPTLTAQSSPFVGKDAISFTKATSLAQKGVAALEVDAASQPEAKVQPLTQAKVSQLNDIFKASNSELQFQLDQDAGKMVLYLKDAKTGETLRQFPDKEALRISKQIDDYLSDIKSHQNPKDAVGQLTGMITNTQV
jgi:flagellar protein FlaG